MRQNPTSKRGRGRSGGRRPYSNPANRSYDSNGPDVKIRGTANHIYDKYQALARDATASGDRVSAENYLQHAEHYFRIISANNANQNSNANAQQPSANEVNGKGRGNGQQPIEAASDARAAPANESRPAAIPPRGNDANTSGNKRAAEETSSPKPAGADDQAGAVKSEAAGKEPAAQAAPEAKAAGVDVAEQTPEGQAKKPGRKRNTSKEDEPDTAPAT